MKQIILILCLIATKLTFGQIANGGFEVWDTIYPGNYAAELADSFGVPNPTGGIAHPWTYGSGYGISRTTDSYSGNYSIILHNWYTYVNETINYHEALNYTPRYLQGYYKYITGSTNGLSQGIATVTSTRFNGTSTDIIATGTYLFNPSDNFIPFQLDLSLTSQIADSIQIVIKNADNSQCKWGSVCNLLYLDNLTFSNSPLGIENFSIKNGVGFYPNPTKDLISFTIQNNENYKLTVYDVYGKLLTNTNISDHSTFSTANFASGIYFLTLLDNNGKTLVTHKIIKEE